MSTEKETWLPITRTQPANSVAVLTKIDDSSGVRNVQPLRREGRLWWLVNGSMYVYYEPTHWQHLPSPPQSK